MASVKIGKIEVLRTIVAFLILLFLTIIPIFEFIYGTTSALNFNNFTLISPLEFILVSLSMKTILPNLIISGLVVIFIIAIFGRFFCGWICPVGISLEYLHNFTKTKWELGALWKNWNKYAILIAILFASFLFDFTAPYLFSPPGCVYRILISLKLQWVIGADLIILISFLILDSFAIRYGRTWCNSICPLGTIITSLSIVNLVKPKVDRKICINNHSKCLSCERICPMRIPITRANRWMMMECNKCLKCWANCPTKAIKIKFF